jgi:phosphoserine phosphatase RsbU/P
MTKKLKLISGVLFFALMFVNVGANFYSVWAEHSAYSQRGWEATEVDGKPIIYEVDADGPASILRVGDEVVSLIVEPHGACPTLNRRECTVLPGTGYKLAVRRGGQTLEIELRTATDSWFYGFALHLVSLIFVGVGLTVFALKPDDKQALLLALMLGAFAGLFIGGTDLLAKWAQVVVELARLCGFAAFFPVFLHFFLLFPERGPWARRFPRLEFWLYPLFLSLFLPLNALAFLGGGELLAKIPGIELVGRLPILSAIVYLISGLAALAMNYRAADANNRRRTRVVAAACGVGILNLLLVLGGGFIGLARAYPRVFDLFGYFLPVTLPLIPISFAYAIIRHQVIPVSLIIRRSLRYLLVSRGAEILEAIAVGVLLISLFHLVLSLWHLSGEVAGVIATIVAVLLWDHIRKLHKRYLAPLIDRRFFRQSYDAHQIIAELTGSLRAVTDLPQLLELVATKLQTALQTEYVTIYLRDPATGSFDNAYSCDYSGANSAAGAGLRGDQLTRYAMMVDQLDKLEKSLGEAEPRGHNGRQADEIELDAILSEYDGEAAPVEKREALRETKATLLMPLSSKDGMLGVISLGPRLGDLPFSREDKQLLTSVSGPTALAIENARLVEQMVAEARRLQEIEVDHRRKTEELAYARQLQLSMLPARNVSLANVEVIGQMRAATEVGGDYYDFIEMADGRICVAVGDATGHGMAAGLVVGMVKMGLINGLQRMNGQASVKQLIEDLNLALKQSLSQRGMGMCLGAAILDASTLQVEVLSNGMPAPYHYRSAIRSLAPIPTQAPPLGFLWRVNVRPVETRLGPGDALIWLSDGFEERMNQANQVWGSEEVERTLERICDEESSAESIAQRMIEACDGAAGGRSNDDDMTIVVAKVKAGLINV